LVLLGDEADKSEANWAKTKEQAAQRVEEKTMMVSMRMKKDVMVRFVKRGSESFPPRTAKIL
jgi:hypothetical protein